MSAENDSKRMSFSEHLEELRRRLLYALAGPAVGFAVCFAFFRERLLELVIRPPYPHWRLFGWDLLVIEPVDVDFSFSTPYAAFVTSMLISLVAGILVTLPWSLGQAWAFVASGLYPRERRCVRILAPVSVGLFAVGTAFFYFVVYPVVIHFLYKFGTDFNAFLAAQGAEPMMTTNTLLDAYVHFAILLMLVFGLMFELPLVVYFLGRTGLVGVDTFRRYRRHVIVALVAAAALVTPPDVFSQVALAIPMWGLYELGVLIVRLTGARHRREAGS